jgi:hypothetical protein
MPHRQCGYLQADGCNNDFSCMAMHPEGHIAAVGEYGPSAAVYVFNVYTMEILAKIIGVPTQHPPQCLPQRARLRAWRPFLLSWLATRALRLHCVARL